MSEQLKTPATRQEKTSQHLKERVARFKKTHSRQQISVDLYLDNEAELEAFNQWKKIKNKKKFFLDAIANHQKKEKPDS
jgi:hypothetical protein